MGKMKGYFISDSDIHSLLNEIQPVVSVYQKKDMIGQNFFRRRKLYLLLEGKIYIYTQNEYDEQELTSCFVKGQIFSGSVLLPYDGRSIRYGVCKAKCRIAAIDPENACRYRLQTPSCTLLEFAYQTTVFHLEQHCHMLQQKTVRSKIMAYFQYESWSQQTQELLLKIPYSDLSNYLQVDRSTLMKELTKMAADGLILKNGKKITLLKAGIEV